MSQTPNSGPSTQTPRQDPAVEPAQAKPVIAAAAAKRANASVIGMILALLVSLAVALPVVLLNAPQKADSYRQPVIVSEVAEQAKDAAGFTPLAPVLPQDWSVNYARWNGAGADKVAFWDVGYVTASTSFISLKQSATANPTWLLQQAKEAPITGERTIAGISWELRDKPGSDKSLTATVPGGSTVILTGSAPLADFDILATAAVSAAQSAVDGSTNGGSK
ncbi:DUF4245 domain-containing protein [Arthrobacter sp. 35W]|uniref:DUF4245 domain-containing protein n=1 Tax=Arthrobacter sp. 35W TaxID=1132441 RepID=UPI0003FB1C9F|nr:DUF4245 domain-containing protein [Arthrobacter sp. 35W]